MERRTFQEATGPMANGELVPLTVLYVHGNWMERDNARERVRIIDRYLARHADRPYRILMLSWPSQRDNRIIRDVRDNALCSDIQSYYAAQILQAISESSECVSLLGFSLGARTVTGALHLNAGDAFGNADDSVLWLRFTLPCCPGRARPRSRLVIEHRSPPSSAGACRVDGEPVQFTRSDSSPFSFHRFDHSTDRSRVCWIRGGRQSPLNAATPNKRRILQFDCGSQIGSTHSELSYYGECPHFQRVINNLLWKNP